MTDAPDARLQRLLGADVLASVRRRLRRHFERSAPEALVTTLRLGDLEPDEHAALCQLTGRPSRAARSMTLDLRELDARLGEAGLADSLRDALEKLEGPIVAVNAVRREMHARWLALVTATSADGRLRAWLEMPAALALLKRLGRKPERAAELLDAAGSVLRRLPATGITRSQLAAETLGDAHGLDAGRPVATLVLAALRHTAAEHDERLRDIWARAGVLVSELARPVLVLNLLFAADALSIGTPGEPSYLSLRYLLRRRSIWPLAGRPVYVCENPDIVAIAADCLGPACAPLVCTDGMPAAAQRALLDQLAASGARLLYHGDYDWAGLGIGNLVMRTWRASPWRFGVADYRAAVDRAPSRPRDLDAGMVLADWDAELGPVMLERGLASAEEAVADLLIEDLRCGG